jgi:hypothetical protein
MKFTTLASLAYLKVNWDANHIGYLDNFFPILKEALRVQKYDVISTTELQSSITSIFGLILPIHVIKTLLIRASKKNIIETRHKNFYRKNDMIQDLGFTENQQRVELIYKTILSRFCEYAQKEFKTIISLEDAERIILAFISYNQIDIVKLEVESIIPSPPNILESEKIIISDYITKVVKQDPLIREYFQTIIIGYMLANAIYLPDPNQVQGKLGRVDFYFDTTYLMFALGFDGDELQKPSKELLDLLYLQGARLCCFRHTVEEIRGILLGCAERKQNHNQKSISRFDSQFSIRGFSSSDLLLEAENIENKIENLRIKIYNKPLYKESVFVIDEKKLAEEINRKISYGNSFALEKDVDSISAIYRIRRGRLSHNIEDSKAIFVTTNNSLSFTANMVFFEEEGRDLIPPCINDFSLTTILWLKSPLKAPNLPLSRIIADSYAALQPSPSFLAKWYAEIEKQKQNGTIDEESYYFMKFSPEVHRSLMEVTLGDDQVITEGRIPEILERARRKIIDEIQLKYNENLDAQKENNNQLYQQLESERTQNNNRNTKIESYAIKKARFIKNGFYVVTVILLVPINIPTIVQIVSKSSLVVTSTIISWTLSLLLIVYHILGLFNILVGISLKDIGHSIEIKCRDAYIKKIRNILE